VSGTCWKLSVISITWYFPVLLNTVISDTFHSHLTFYLNLPDFGYIILHTSWWSWFLLRECAGGIEATSACSVTLYCFKSGS
jgi:hypothetical protein